MKLRAPFPWFGGKSRVAHVVWESFGDVANYVEPFFGSGAVLLGRPHEARVETVNDLDCYLANFWRAISADPDAVAAAADWPINEADLHARHRWLVDQTAFRERMKTDPDYFDVKIAGWWVWGLCQWIGSGWCSEPSWTGRPGCHNGARGMFTTRWNSRPAMQEMGVHGRRLVRRRPRLGGKNDVGVHKSALWAKRPAWRRGGVGVNSNGQGDARSAALREWFGSLQDRLRRVRVCCGDWKRILGPSPTVHIGVTGVFLDPPYEPTEIAKGAGRHGLAKTDKLYSHHTAGVSAEVRAWALEHGDDPKLRIALCGYEGEHEMPSSWSVHAWVASGGYSNRGKNPRRNAGRERIWLSPHCLRPAASSPLFAEITS